jgi:hypothetical protein
MPKSISATGFKRSFHKRLARPLEELEYSQKIIVCKATNQKFLFTGRDWVLISFRKAEERKAHEKN